MIARWRELGLVAGPAWHWDLADRRMTLSLDQPIAARLMLEAARRDVTVSELVGELLADWSGAEPGLRAAVSAKCRWQGRSLPGILPSWL